MSNEEITENLPKRKPVGNLTDYVLGAEEDNPLNIEITIDDGGRVVMFHDKEFSEKITMYEYDLTTSRLEFVMGDGEKRDFGFALKPEISKHMQNAHQILTVLLNDRTGEGETGQYIPVIIHKS